MSESATPRRRGLRVLSPETKWEIVLQVTSRETRGPGRGDLSEPVARPQCTIRARGGMAGLGGHLVNRLLCRT